MRPPTRLFPLCSRQIFDYFIILRNDLAQKAKLKEVTMFQSTVASILDTNTCKLLLHIAVYLLHLQSTQSTLHTLQTFVHKVLLTNAEETQRGGGGGLEERPVQITEGRRTGKRPGATMLHGFVFLGSTTVCRVYKLTLSDRAQLTLHLRVSSFLFSVNTRTVRRSALVAGPESTLGSPAIYT
jgi:hypothetical protein